jgi:hypothetical protein
MFSFWEGVWGQPLIKEQQLDVSIRFGNDFG